MQSICLDAHDSILRDCVEAVKHFHWETVMLELLQNVPTLMRLLSMMIRRLAERKPLICILASQLLMTWHKHMALVQRAVSVMLYGIGTAKQVHEIFGTRFQLILIVLCDYILVGLCKLATSWLMYIIPWDNEINRQDQWGPWCRGSVMGRGTGSPD